MYNAISGYICLCQSYLDLRPFGTLATHSCLDNGNNSNPGMLFRVTGITTNSPELVFITNTAVTSSNDGASDPRGPLTLRIDTDFDGIDDYANGSSLIGNLPSSTMMGWIKADEIRGADIMGQDSFRIFTNNLGQLQTEVKTGTTTTTAASTTTAITPNLWSHVAATYNGTTNTLTLYINGEQVAQIATTGNTLNADTNDFEIGRRSNGDDRYFKGDMQELKVYNVALSSTQLW